jgi:hypothetical protein
MCGEGRAGLWSIRRSRFYTGRGWATCMARGPKARLSFETFLASRLSLEALKLRHLDWLIGSEPHNHPPLDFLVNKLRSMEAKQSHRPIPPQPEPCVPFGQIYPGGSVGIFRVKEVATSPVSFRQLIAREKTSFDMTYYAAKPIGGKLAPNRNWIEMRI